MARKKKTDEEPVIAPEVEKEELAAVSAPEQAAEVKETLDPLQVEAERPAMPQMEGQYVPTTESGLAPKRQPRAKTGDEIRAELRANLENDSVGTFEKEAAKQGAASLENTPDFQTTKDNYMQELDNKSFAQWALERKKADEERLAAEQAEIERERKAARMTGFAELGSALANLFGVAEGHAAPQTYKQYSQDWMKKADADARAHRDHIADLRQRQADTELKMAQLRQQGFRETEKLARQREADRLNNEYRKAQIAWQNARTEAERAEAAQKAREAEVKIERIYTQMGADVALAKQRLASAAAAAQNASTKKNESERKGEQQERLNESKVKLNEAKVGESESRAAYNWSRATGQPAPGWGVQLPGGAAVPAPAENNTDEDGFLIVKKK